MDDRTSDERSIAVDATAITRAEAAFLARNCRMKAAAARQAGHAAMAQTWEKTAAGWDVVCAEPAPGGSIVEQIIGEAEAEAAASCVVPAELRGALLSHLLDLADCDRDAEIGPYLRGYMAALDGAAGKAGL